MSRRISVGELIRVRKSEGKRAMLRSLWGRVGNWIGKACFWVRSGERKEVLMFAHTPLMVEHLERYFRVVSKGVPGEVRFSIVLFGLTGAILEDQSARCETIGFRRIQAWTVPLRRWDLCVVADHSYPWDLLGGEIPVLFIYHGLGLAKMYDGQNYKYGKRYIYDSFGRLKYSKAFESGEFQKRHAELIDPKLADSVEVVGDLGVDAFLAFDQKRRQIRSDLGYDETDVLVVIQSTWGPHSLDLRLGDALFNSCGELARTSSYRFVISTHPNHWGGNSICEDRSEFYRSLDQSGVKVLAPGEDRIKYLASADVCLSDVTTLATVYAMSGRPLLFFSDGELEIDAQSELARLLELCPRIEEGEELEAILVRGREEWDAEKLETFLPQICSFQGQATKRIVDETLKMMV